MRWNLFGRRVHSGAAKLFIIVCLVVWLPLTLPLHIIVRLFDGRGFIVHRGRGHFYEPPAWASYGSLIGAILLAVVLL